MDSAGVDSSGAVLTSMTAVISGTQAIWQNKVGSDLEDHTIRLLVTLSDGQVLEEDILMEVREQ